MNSNNKSKIFSDGFTGTLAIIGGIAGTIIFVVTVFGEWYAEFDIEPVGLITGILTIALFLLPFAISLIVGGGMGLLAGGFLGVFIEFLVNSIVSFIRHKIDQAHKRKERKKASRKINKANKNIQDDIIQLKTIRKQLSASDEAIIANYHLCLLIEKTAENPNVIFDCLSRCKEAYVVLNKAKTIEDRIKALSEQYRIIGDAKNADYYLSLIK